QGCFYPPTLLTGVEPASTVASVEIFGPVLVAMSFRTPAEAVLLGNNTRYGLAASVWSQDIDTAMDVARKLKAGTIWINSTNLFDAASGFGGYRESGYGREGGKEGMYDVLVEEGHGVSHPHKIETPAQQHAPVQHNGSNGAGKIDRTFRFLIGGKLVRPDQMGSYSILSPGGELVAVVGQANRKDVRNAVEAARNASNSWFESAPHLRAQILYFFAENLANERERFAKGIVAQTGWSMDAANVEVDRSISRIFDFAAYADKYGGTVQPVLGRRLVVGLREPVGVIGMRLPDESPLLGLVSLIASSVSMANTIVGCAGRYAMTAMDLVQVIQHSDIPAGVINLMTAENPDEIGKILADHEDVDAIWFFGSAEGSKNAEAASISNMKQTWVSNGDLLDWSGMKSEKFLQKSTQVKNIWAPYGV
ncbi:MAG TPA: aldehyde dehydrogenase family protein, partial [Bacteroidota bacterium]|nr:aldehyde dehydrogenase family protein [Bacteroidota bacterium]